MSKDVNHNTRGIAISREKISGREVRLGIKFKVQQFIILIVSHQITFSTNIRVSLRTYNTFLLTEFLSRMNYY